jgi:hypothetical protein
VDPVFGGGGRGGVWRHLGYPLWLHHRGEVTTYLLHTYVIVDVRYSKR